MGRFIFVLLHSNPVAGNRNNGGDFARLLHVYVWRTTENKSTTNSNGYYLMSFDSHQNLGFDLIWNIPFFFIINTILLKIAQECVKSAHYSDMLAHFHLEKWPRLAPWQQLLKSGSNRRGLLFFVGYSFTLTVEKKALIKKQSWARLKSLTSP